MTFVTEFMESRSITTSGGRGNGRRVFHASGYSNPGDVFDLFGTGVLPRKYERHPDFPGLIARDFTLTLVGGHTDLWKIEWTYEQLSAGSIAQPAEVPPVEVLPNEVQYVEASAEIRAEFVLAYRIDVTYPPSNDGQPVDDEVEVEGEGIDKKGIPLSIQRNIQEITLTETVNVPDLNTYRSFRFLRNSEPFLDMPTGKVLYRGASIRRTGVDVFQVAHSFVEDGDYHLQQSPRIDGDGQPFLKDGKAEDVYWVQPFGTLGDFNNISTNF
tara:strand:+ start:4141 stop:4950 length:810 start_codon:yes stop_codon:yes gene_type:complete